VERRNAPRAVNIPAGWHVGGIPATGTEADSHPLAVFHQMDAYWQVYSTYVLLAIFQYFSTDLMARSLGFDNSLALAALANSQAIALAIPPGTPLRMIIGYPRAAARLISQRVGGHRCTQSWRIVVVDGSHHIGRDRIRRSACMLYSPEN
jgi:hypothetical protein